LLSNELVQSSYRYNAANPWLILDPDDPRRIATANAATLGGAPPGATSNLSSTVFFNAPFKYMPGPDHPAGQERWCNSYAIDDDVDGREEIYVYSKAGPACPEVPDPAKLAADGLDAPDVLKKYGVTTVAAMSKL
jgi:hypothetical protein